MSALTLSGVPAFESSKWSPWDLPGNVVDAVILNAARVAASVASITVADLDQAKVNFAIVEQVVPRQYASAVQLLQTARTTLAPFAWADNAPSEAANQTVGRFLRLFVADGGPTPQPALLVDGGVELQWRVNGNNVSAIAEDDGSAYLYARTAGGTYVADEEIPAGGAPTEEAVREVRRLLETMGREVRHRIESAVLL